MALYVFDDVLTESERLVTLNYFLSFGKPTKFAWADGSLNVLLSYGSPLSHLLQIVSEHVDLSAMVGCEYWSNLNSKTGWHKDTDETKRFRDNIESYPICSVVYYPHVNNLMGGALLFDSFSVSPLTNRLVVFAPGLLHCVQDFSGDRVSIAINPWNYKLEHACQSA